MVLAIHRRSIHHPDRPRCCMDLIYLAGISLLFVLAAGLAAGCAKLGGPP